VLRVSHTTVEITVDHQTAGRLDNELRSAGHRIAHIEYCSDVRLTVLVPTARTAPFERWLAERTAGRAGVDFGEEVHIDVPDTDE
jgi:putative IMPACT (imprinted ancient) family translation regulator